MTKGKDVIRKVVNVYQALEKKLLVNDKLPSGWNDDDLNDAILYDSMNVTSLAIRMHGSACMQYKLQMDAAKDLYSFAEPGTEEALEAKAAIMVLIKAGVPTLEDMRKQLLNQHSEGTARQHDE